MAEYIEKEKLINEISNYFKAEWEVPCSSSDKLAQTTICKVYDIIRKQPVQEIATCEECMYYEVCKEIESLPQRKDFIWYRAESGCPHFKNRTDLVEVVRCADCRKLKIINDGKVYAKCTETGFEFSPFGTNTRKHFCNYGERKD